MAGGTTPPRPDGRGQRRLCRGGEHLRPGRERRALAVGYQRAIGNRASVSLGGAFSGSEKSVSAGAGFSW
ncbi:YadA-like family protein [Pantoea ananatis]|nr:YadA-like family protein [Pantoea ananatis]